MSYKYTRLTTIPIEPVVAAMNQGQSSLKLEEFISTDDFKKVKEISINSNRLLTFTKGICCVNCLKEGHYFAIEKLRGARWHLNLYHSAGTQEIMITSDHIVAKANGGNSSLDNRQPMCSVCNNLKSDYASIEEAVSARHNREILKNTPEYLTIKFTKICTSLEYASERAALGDTTNDWARIEKEMILKYNKLKNHLLLLIKHGHMFPTIAEMLA